MPLVTAMSLQPGSPSLTVAQAASSAHTSPALLSAAASNSTLNRFMASLLFSSVLGTSKNVGEAASARQKQAKNDRGRARLYEL